MPLTFTPSPGLTLGTEIELQILDGRTRNLTAGALAILDRLPGRSDIKPELFQSMIEINTGICRDVAEVRRDLDAAVAALRGACDGLGLDLAGAGSHPFALYHERVPFPAERYEALIDRNRWLAQRLMIFGLHVHVGMRDGEHAMAILNGMLRWLPHLLALSASSPFWQAADTGLASSRVTIFEALPTAGHPCTFASWADFEAFYDAMVASRGITSIRDIWWDIRPHPDLGTIEIRVCDGLPSLSEAVAIVALVHGLADRLDARWRAGERFAPPPYWLLRENKWRASRWGLEAELLVDASGRTAPVRREIDALLADLEPRAVALKTGAALRTVEAIVRGAGSYERQRRVFDRTRSYEAVATSLAEEFRADGPLS